jgi:hypothetical protein
VILAGEESAIRRAVSNANATRRWTRLAVILRSNVRSAPS